MKANPNQDSILALVALIITLAAAYWLDQGVFLLVQQASRTFNTRPAIWLTVLANLALAAGLVALVWWQATRATYPRIIDALYVLAGGAAVLIVPLAFTLPLAIPLYGLMNSGRVSFWSVTGAVLAMAGLFHLFRRRPMA
jgi:hypothetical protein